MLTAASIWYAHSCLDLAFYTLANEFDVRLETLFMVGQACLFTSVCRTWAFGVVWLCSVMFFLLFKIPLILAIACVQHAHAGYLLCLLKALRIFTSGLALPYFPGAVQSHVSLYRCLGSAQLIGRCIRIQRWTKFRNLLPVLFQPLTTSWGMEICIFISSSRSVSIVPGYHSLL